MAQICEMFNKQQFMDEAMHGEKYLDQATGEALYRHYMYWEPCTDDKPQWLTWFEDALYTYGPQYINLVRIQTTEIDPLVSEYMERQLKRYSETNAETTQTQTGKQSTDSTGTQTGSDKTTTDSTQETTSETTDSRTGKGNTTSKTTHDTTVTTDEDKTTSGTETRTNKPDSTVAVSHKYDHTSTAKTTHDTTESTGVSENGSGSTQHGETIETTHNQDTTTRTPGKQTVTTQRNGTDTDTTHTQALSGELPQTTQYAANAGMPQNLNWRYGTAQQEGTSTNTHKAGTGETVTTEAQPETSVRTGGDTVTHGGTDSTTSSKATDSTTTHTGTDTTTTSEMTNGADGDTDTTRTTGTTENISGETTTTETGTTTQATTGTDTVNGTSESSENGTSKVAGNQTGNTTSTITKTSQDTRTQTTENNGSTNGTQSGTQSGEDREIYSGRHASPQAMLDEARRYIENMNAFKWLCRQLDDCFYLPYNIKCNKRYYTEGWWRYDY